MWRDGWICIFHSRPKLVYLNTWSINHIILRTTCREAGRQEWGSVCGRQTGHTSLFWHGDNICEQNTLNEWDDYACSHPRCNTSSNTSLCQTVASTPSSRVTVYRNEKQTPDQSGSQDFVDIPCHMTPAFQSPLPGMAVTERVAPPLYLRESNV